jgi:hypothetical protein
MKRYNLVILKIEMVGNDQIDTLLDLQAYLNGCLESNDETVKIKYSTEMYEFPNTVSGVVEKREVDDKNIFEWKEP